MKTYADFMHARDILQVHRSDYIAGFLFLVLLSDDSPAGFLL